MSFRSPNAGNKLNIDVVAKVSDLTPGQLHGKSVVVFDVLRATTTITAALAAGVAEIRVFGNVEAAAMAAKSHGAGRILCGEIKCLPPAGFDLGNSPGAFQADLHGGRTVYLSTTNGTRAVIAARGAEAIYAGAIVNAAAVAQRLMTAGRDVTLLCAGTDGALAMEDLLGAGAVLDELHAMGGARCASDTARVALRLFRAERDRLPEVLRESTGGQNVIAAGLDADITFAARLNVFDVVGVVHEEPLRIRLS